MINSPTLPSAPNMSLRDPQSKLLDAQRIAATLGVSPARAARMLGVAPSTVSRNPDSNRIQARAATIEAILQNLHSAFGDYDAAVAWLKTPSEFWGKGNPTALDLIEQGRAQEVLAAAVMVRRGEPFA